MTGDIKEMKNSEGVVSGGAIFFKKACRQNNKNNYNGFGFMV